MFSASTVTVAGADGRVPAAPPKRDEHISGGMIGEQPLPTMHGGIAGPEVRTSSQQATVDYYVPDDTLRSEYATMVRNNRANQSWESLLPATIWAVGALPAFAPFLGSLIRLRTLRTRLGVLRTGREYLLLEEIAQKVRLDRMPTLLIDLDGADISVPITWGFWKPNIVLPGTAINWESDVDYAALLHETGHIERRDWVGHIAASAIGSSGAPPKSDTVYRPDNAFTECVNANASRKYDILVVAVDSGARIVKELINCTTFELANGCHWDEGFIPKMLLPKIAAFRIYARPYPWVEFDNVKLNPE